ncbi:odorant-binding protein 2b-like [Bubalus bubalis]|uniref:odorant-binding protein 2b-like n=1 Tax=Bubalus bubalis TaxID=89462 RepID=UPI001E1B8146|nr:odorant-binding protein 2b-like [Bubalus bubalis]
MCIGEAQKKWCGRGGGKLASGLRAGATHSSCRVAISWELKDPEMKALLLPIALSLLAALRAQDPPSCPLEPQQDCPGNSSISGPREATPGTPDGMATPSAEKTHRIAGTWYVKAMVTDENLPKETRPRKVSPVTVTALGGGDLELIFTFLKEARCHEKRTRVQPTGEPGKYSSNGGKKQMHILELPVEGHYILYCEGQRQGKSVHVGKLIGRNPDMNPEALEAFKKFVQRKGLSPEDVFTPEQTGSLPPSPPTPPQPLCGETSAL